MNHQIDMGAKQPLSGFLCQEVSKVRNRYMNTLKLEKKNTMHSWNRETIKSLLDFSNALWKFRSDILHDEAVFTQETMLRDQAIQLLSTLQFTPYQLPQNHTNFSTAQNPTCKQATCAISSRGQSE